MSDKATERAALIKYKMQSGLTAEQAEAVVKAQEAHDEALAKLTAPAEVAEGDKTPGDKKPKK